MQMAIVQSGTFGAGKGNPQWRLLDGSGLRVFRQHIHFPQPFAAAPKVIASLSGLDILHGQNHRLTVTVENISAHGFDLLFNTWADTRVWSASASWIAHL
jgi:hypothetical protein